MYEVAFMSSLGLNTVGHQADYRRQQLMEEAAQNRLARIAGANNMTLNQRFALWLGNGLISIGVGLRRRNYRRRGQVYLSVTPFESRMEY